LSAYSVASSVAELELYQTQTDWANGTASDEKYLAALTKALGATPPQSHDRIAAQNRLDDATYTIGRQLAQDKGLDDLIAFDQQSLAKMRSDNNHADDIKNALNNELAQRRSKDYSALVQKTNNGTMSMTDLLAWVDNTIKTLPADAPDKDNWGQARDSVNSQVQNDKDSQVYQDYQNQRMTGADFLTYVQGRRDQYQPDSANYADWNRRLEDGQKNVKDTEFSKADSAFFDLYNEGKKSDKDYLGYIKSRLDGMDTSDPQYETWRHRYTTTSFSLAEDQLRFDVSEKKRPVSALVSFYNAYASTLDKGSAEYRSTLSKIHSLKGYSSGGGGGSGGGGTGSAITAAKVINGQYALDTVLHDMTINPNAPKKDRSAAEAMFTANYNSLSKAHTAGDKVWLFIDPSKPGAVTAAQNPDGSPILDDAGKPVLVRGSGYIPVTDEALGNLNTLDEQYHTQLATNALKNGDLKAFYSETNQANSAAAKRRSLDLSVYQKSNDLLYENSKLVIAQQLQTGDTAAAYNTTTAAIKQISDDLQDPTMTDSRRTKLEDLANKLAEQPFMPQIDDVSGDQTGGAIIKGASDFDPKTGEMLRAQIGQNWHYALADGNTRTTNGWVQDTSVAATEESWAASHLTVTMMYKGQVVTGDVAIHDASRAPKIIANINGVDQVIASPGSVSEVQYKDEFGNTVLAYSCDKGQTWITSDQGVPPQLQMNGMFTMTNDGQLIDSHTGTVVGKADSDGVMQFDPKANVAMTWYGQNGTIPGMEGLGAPGIQFKIFGSSNNGQALDVRSTAERYASSDGVAATAVADILRRVSAVQSLGPTAVLTKDDKVALEQDFANVMKNAPTLLDQASSFVNDLFHPKPKTLDLAPAASHLPATVGAVANIFGTLAKEQQGRAGLGAIGPKQLAQLNAETAARIGPSLRADIETAVKNAPSLINSVASAVGSLFTPKAPTTALPLVTPVAPSSLDEALKRTQANLNLTAPAVSAPSNRDEALRKIAPPPIRKVAKPNRVADRTVNANSTTVGTPSNMDEAIAKMQGR
jgi:hypothetical protein